MPKSPKHFAVARQWQILQLIPIRAPGISARQLVGQLEDSGIRVSKRTVERDLNELSLVFDLCNDNMGNDGTQGWYFATNRVPSIGSIDHLDAILLVLAGDVLDQMLPKEAYGVIASRIDKARDKLKGMKRSPLVSWIDKVRYVPPSMVHERPKVDPVVLRCVQRALVHEQQLEVRYAPFGRPATQYRLQPLGLVLRGPVLYLVATAFDYEDVRLYGLHRIRKARLCDEPVDRHETFSIDAYIEKGAMGFQAGEKIAIKACITEDLAKILIESPISKDQSIGDVEGRQILTATVHESWQLRAWILSQGPDLTVLAPDSLRQCIQQKLHSASGNYLAGAG